MKRLLLVGLFAAGSVMAAKPKHQEVPVEVAANARAAKLIESAKDVARNKLSDPESARFRNVFLSPQGILVCGEVNAKNKMGGYVGFRRFFSVGTSAYFDDSESSYVSESWAAECLATAPTGP